MVTSNRPLKVFLCYTHTDTNEVKQLHDLLVNDGVDVWMDKEKLFGGSNWEYEIRKAVRETDIFIACVSTQFTKRFSQKYFSRTEVGIALDEAALKSKSEIFIIPARLENCKVPKSLTTWHWVDLFEEQGYQKLILSLNKRIEQLDKDESSENPQISIVISGDVHGNVIVGDNNIAQFTLDNQQEFSQEKTEKEEIIENIVPEIEEEKQSIVTEELKHEKAHNEEEKKTERERFEQSAWDKERELAERARIIAQNRLEKKELAKKSMPENISKPLDNTNLKVKPFWAYSGAIIISLLFSIGIGVSVFFFSAISSTLPSVLLLIFIISIGIWAVITHRYLVFLLGYTIFILLLFVSIIIDNLFYNTPNQFGALFTIILISEFLALYIVFFLLKISNAQKLIYKVLLIFLASLILVLTALLLSIFFTINMEEIYIFLSYLSLYFLICSYLGNWFERIIKNNFPIFFG